MHIVHIISVGINGGENIIQKYLNYAKIYKRLKVQYTLLILVPLDIQTDSFHDESIVFFKTYVASRKCLLKRLWMNALPKVEKVLDKIEYTDIIIRIDSIDKSLLDFIKQYKPILEYPTPPIEKTLVDKPIYQKLAQKYNHIALTCAPFNITPMEVGYVNSYILHNSLYDQHVQKKNFILSKNIKVLFMSSKYGYNEYNGYDRFLEGIDLYLKSPEPQYSFEFLIAGHDVNGFKSMLSTNILKQVKMNFLGFQTISELNQIIESVDLGINDLAAHRKGLDKANALKTIDFIAWNLPFIISHKDVNISAEQGYCYKIEESDFPVDIEAIIVFLKSIDEVSIAQMQEQKKKISLQNRIQKFIKFLEKSEDV